MESLETELERARDLPVAELADAIESIGFECTRCGGCCKAAEPSGCGDASGEGGSSSGEQPPDESRGGTPADGDDRTDASPEPHTATVFPDEIRRLRTAAGGDGDTPYDWRDVARPMPYGLETVDGDPEGETFEWALQTDDCGNCTFYTEADDGTGACTVHDDRPLICRTYPFSLALGGASEPMGEAVDREGLVRAHECEGLDRDIDRESAESLAEALKERTIRDLEEAIAVRESYEPVDADGVVVHDSEGQKRPDGTAIRDGTAFDGR